MQIFYLQIINNRPFSTDYILCDYILCDDYRTVILEVRLEVSRRCRNVLSLEWYGRQPRSIFTTFNLVSGLEVNLVV